MSPESRGLSGHYLATLWVPSHHLEIALRDFEPVSDTPLPSGIVCQVGNTSIVSDPDAYQETMNILDRVLPEEYTSTYENYSHAVSDGELIKIDGIANEVDKISAFDLL